MFTSWSEVSTPALLSIASVLMRPPASAYSTRPSWVNPRLPPSPTLRQRSSAPSTRTASFALSPTSALRLGARLHVGADAAVVEQVDGRAQDRADQLGRRARVDVGVDAEPGAHLVGDRDRLQRARVDAAAGGDAARCRSRPTTSGAARTAACRSCHERFGVGIGIEEHVPVIERGDEPDVLRQQHPVAEHVARHVADADDGEVVAVGIDAEVAEVAAHRLPRAAGGDAHRLVVVAVARRPTRTRRRARSRGRARSRWRRRRTRRCPCRPRRRGRDRRRRSARPGRAARPPTTVGAVTRLSVTSSSAADEQAVAGLDLGARAARRSAGGRLTTKPPFAPDGHDHRVLHPLRLHEPEHFGAEVFAPVRPADAAARDLARAQVHALDARRVHEDLEQRARQRQVGDRAGSSFSTTHGRGPAGVVGLEPVRAQRREHEVQQRAQDAVLVEAGDRVELGADLVDERSLGRSPLGVRLLRRHSRDRGARANSSTSRRAISGCAASASPM